MHDVGESTSVLDEIYMPQLRYKLNIKYLVQRIVGVVPHNHFHHTQPTLIKMVHRARYIH